MTLRTGTKREQAIEIMKTHSDKPMDEVCQMIAIATQQSIGNARQYYRWAVLNGHASGLIKNKRRGRIGQPVEVSDAQAQQLADMSQSVEPSEIAPELDETELHSYVEQVRQSS